MRSVIDLSGTVHGNHRAIHALALVIPRTQAYHYAMRNTATIIILSVVATVLVFGIGICIAIKPFTAIGLAPILAAISLIIKAIRGRPTHPHESPNTQPSTPATPG